LKLCLESLTLWRGQGDARGTALAAQRAGLIAGRLGKAAEAEELEMESLEILDGLVDEPWAARAASTGLSHLGHIAMNRGDPAEAECWVMSRGRAMRLPACHVSLSDRWPVLVVTSMLREIIFVPG
jgi:hypothetical protein